MMLRVKVVVVCVFFVILAIAGCQGDKQSSIPVTPDGNSSLETGGSPLLGGKTGNWSGGHHLLALVQVSINAETRSIEVTPLRTAFQHLNLLQLLPIYCKPVSSCLDFINLVIHEPTATCDLDVVVRHPIPDPYTDLYDLRGIGIFKGTLDGGFTAGKVATQILNADGWTTAYDAAGPYDAFINPYIAFNKKLPKRKFANTTQTIEHFTVKFPSLSPNDATFLYALDGSWADPYLIDPGNPLTDPNLPEPYQVNILYTDPMSNKFDSKATVVVELFDWQKNAYGATLECPKLIPGAFNMTQKYAKDGRYVFYYDIVNDSVPLPGKYPFLVKAMDEFESQADLINPTIYVNLTNYQLGYVNVYDSQLNTAPIAKAVASDYEIMAGQWIQFDASGSTDAEDGSVNIFAWDLHGDFLFDDGNTSKIDYQFVNVGEYLVNVKVTDSEGLTDILNEPIIIKVTESPNTPPIASAFASNYNPGIGQTITLDGSNSSDLEDIKPKLWEWDLDGDGDYDDKTGEVVQTSWPSAGTYMVDLRVTDSGGLTDTLDTKLQIKVIDLNNKPPVAKASADKMSAGVGETIIFDGTSSYDPEDGSVSLFAWDMLGSGKYKDAFSPIVPYKFWAPGTYFVDLKVTDSQGLTDTLDVPLAIEITGPPNQPPVAIAKASDTLVYQDELITFDASDSYDPEEGKVNSYAWDLDGDGLYSEGFTAKVDWAYLLPGDYYVNVRVSDTPGLTDTLDVPIHIKVQLGSNTPPVAVAKANKLYAYEGDSIQFDGSDSYDAEDGSPVSWGWEFDGDNDYNDSPFIIASYTYNTEGIYFVDLKVTDKDGATDTLDIPLTINIVPFGTNFPPVAKGNINCAFPIVGQKVHFTDSSYDMDGSVVKWEWDFNDNTGWHDYTLTKGEAWYSFSKEGIYSVMLRVTDNQGGVDEIDWPITIFVSKPDFSPPTGPASCPDSIMTHFYATSFSFSSPNTSSGCRDIAFLSDGSYVMVYSGALYRIGFLMTPYDPPAMYSADWIKSIDISSSNIVALSNLSDGIVKVYLADINVSFMLSKIKDINIGKPIKAVCFDDSNNLYVYGGGEIFKFSSPGYEFDPCDVFPVAALDSYGEVNDMDFNPWNHSLYFAINDGGNGTVVEVNYLGEIESVESNVLSGPSAFLDIAIDKDIKKPEAASCRIVVGGGTNQAYITRLNADLNVLAKDAYGFWGIRSLAIAPTPTNEILVIEHCCVSWLDLLVPPLDWTDTGD